MSASLPEDLPAATQTEARPELRAGLRPGLRLPVGVPAAETPSLASLMTLAVGVVTVAALYLAREVLIPIVLALLLAFVLAPLVSLLRRLRLGRAFSSILSVLLALAALAALGGLIGTQLADLAGQMPRYQFTIEQKVNMVRGATLGRMTQDLQDLSAQLKGPTPPPAPAPQHKSGAAKQVAPAASDKPMQVEVHQPAPAPLDLLRRILGPVLGPLATTAVVFILAVFILLQREDLRDRMIRLFGSRDLHRTTLAMNDAAKRLSRYFLMQIAINGCFGVVIGLGLWAIGVPSALLWGVMAGLLRFVPYVGAPLAALLPLLLAAAVDPGWSMMLWTAALFLVLEFSVGQALEPMLYGRSTGLSPFAVVIAATFWIWLWGPIGLILSTPLTLCLVVMGRHVERLEFLDVLLGDRPALTPVEGFYQRILAGDADEVEEQAEVLLKERSLSSYYDEVALKGLQLASQDAQREVLSARQVERMLLAISTVVEELDVYPDHDPTSEEQPSEGPVPRASVEPAAQPQAAGTGHAVQRWRPEWQTQAPVLCIAGRGPLDMAATAMLAQLLTKNGIGTRVVDQEAVARGAFGALAVEGVMMVCLCYLELSGAPSHLRYLVRRLRTRLPAARIMIAVWPGEDELADPERARNAIGADGYARTLREVVVAGLEAAAVPEQAGAS